MFSVSPFITVIQFTHPLRCIDVHLGSGVKTQLDFLQQGLPGEEPFQQVVLKLLKILIYVLNFIARILWYEHALYLMT